MISILKVGCTNWKRVLLVLGGKINQTDPENISPSDAHSLRYQKYLNTLYEYNRSDVETILREYYSFMIVREPTERLISAYYSKFNISYNTYFHERFGRKIIRMYRNNPSPQSLKNGNDVTIVEFLQYLTNVKSQSMLNEHWAPYHNLCHPCAMQYDYIGYYEHLTEDIQHISKEGGIDVKYPPSRTPKRRLSTRQLMYESLKDVPQELINKLWNGLIRIDYEMFNYTLPLDLITNRTLKKELLQNVHH